MGYLELERFVKTCQEAGRRVYDIDVKIPINVSYSEYSSSAFDPENGAVVPSDYRKNSLNYGRRFDLATTVSDAMFDIKSRESMRKISKQFVERSDFRDVEWSNYIIDGGIKGAACQSGAERMLFLIGEHSLIKDHKRVSDSLPQNWYNRCSKPLEVLSRFEGLKNDISTNKVISEVLREYAKLIVKKDAPIQGIKEEDIKKVLGLIAEVKLPYTHNAAPLLENLESKVFQKFVSEWKPRDLNEEVLGIDPIPYFLINRKFDIPKEHKKVIKQEVENVLRN